jgi:GAF domain-containing protein
VPDRDEAVAQYDDLIDLFDRLTAACVDLFAAHSAGLMLTDPQGALELVHSSSAAMRELELLELRSGEGPCVDAQVTGAEVAVDLREAGAWERWPRFTAAARQTGFCGVQALPMRARGTTIGALNIFHTAVGRWSEHDTAVAQALADLTAIAIQHRRHLTDSELLTGQLQHALNGRVVIEQAKGLLAERGRMGVDAAFAVLRSFCRSTRVSLTSTARELVEGRLDPDDVLASRWPPSPD